MRMLFTIDKKDYDKNGTSFVRPSVRGIIIKNGKLAMIHSLKYDYYKFPGGGADEGEDHTQTLAREVREESGLIVIPSSVREYGQVHRVQKGFDSDMFVQDNYYYLCEVEDEVQSQQLEENEAAEEFVLEWVEPYEAIKANYHHDHGEKKGNERFECIIERETRVIEMLISDGRLPDANTTPSKAEIIVFRISLIPYALIILYGIFCAFEGAEFFSTSYGIGGFMIGVIAAVIGMCMIPVLPICIVIQIAYLIRRKISRLSSIDVKKFIKTTAVVAAIVAASFVLLTFSGEISTYFEKRRAIKMLNSADVLIEYGMSTTFVSGIFNIEGIVHDTLIIDYDTHEVGIIVSYNLNDVFWKVKLEKADPDSNVIQHIKQDYYPQAEFKLSSPGTVLLSFSPNESSYDWTVAFILEAEDGSVYYIDNITENGSSSVPYTALSSKYYTVHYNNEEEE